MAKYLQRVYPVGCCTLSAFGFRAKRTPKTGEIIPLYHPRQNRWQEHFRLSEAEFIPLTPIGRVTTKLLQLNRSDRIKERQLLLQAGIIQRSQ